MTLDQRPRRTRRGNPIVAQDPGSPGSRPIALILTLLFAALAIGWQNLPQNLQRRAVMGAEPMPAVQTADARAPGGMFTEMYVRMYLKMNNSPTLKNELAKDPTQLDALIDQVDLFAESPADRVRTVMLSAEMQGAATAQERIDTLRLDLISQQEDPLPESDNAELDAARASANDTSLGLALEELDILEAIYARGTDTIDQAAKDQLLARYHIFGEHTLTWGQPDEIRGDVLGPPWALFVVMIFFGLLVIAAIFAGFVLFVWGLIWIGNPRTRFHNPVPMPGGSVMLETYAWFVGAFFVYVVAATAIEYHAPEYAMYMLPAQWLLMLVPLWPIVRGMHSRSWRHAVGLTRGQGVFREIGAGFVAYLASLPIFLVGVGITLVVILVQAAIQASQTGGSPTPVPPNNPVVDLIGSGNVLVIVFIVTLATIWAPITEELIFRGALFRHLRGRVAWPIAALVSAVLFAYMHSYGPLFVAPLIALGFMFAFMREWRGSIIAPMTAHFLHNGTLVCLMVSMAYALS